MTERREFLRQATLIAAGGVAASGVAAANPLLAHDAVAGTPQGAGQGANQWDMSWAARVNGRYKMAFDAHQISGGVCLHQVRVFLSGYRDTMGLADSDLSAVLIIRHAAIPMALGDEAWSDGKAGEADALKDPMTGEPTKRNPFINIAPGSPHWQLWPDAPLDTLMSRGVIVLACELALRNFAGRLAEWRGVSRQEGLAIVNRSLLPGIYRMPSGIFATSHAQQLGCGVMNAV